MLGTVPNSAFDCISINTSWGRHGRLWADWRQDGSLAQFFTESVPTANSLTCIGMVAVMACLKDRSTVPLLIARMFPDVWKLHLLSLELFSASCLESPEKDVHSIMQNSLSNALQACRWTHRLIGQFKPLPLHWQVWKSCVCDVTCFLASDDTPCQVSTPPSETALFLSCGTCGMSNEDGN